MSNTSTRLFSYKIIHDSGFAPNPFGKCLTFATCKAHIRLAKRVDDWIAGFTSGELCGSPVGEEKLVYLMRVSEIIPIRDYYYDPRFKDKIPSKGHADPIRRRGDNIYKYIPEENRYEEIPNDNHCDEMEDDIFGENVLVAEEFYYFGREPLAIPADKRPKVPRGQSRDGNQTHDNGLANAFIDYVKANAPIGQKLPHDWPDE